MLNYQNFVKFHFIIFRGGLYKSLTNHIQNAYYNQNQIIQFCIVKYGLLQKLLYLITLKLNFGSAE